MFNLMIRQNMTCISIKWIGHQSIFRVSINEPIIRLYHTSNPFNIIHSHRLKGILIYIYYFGIPMFHGMDDLDHRNPGIAPPPAVTSLGLAWDLDSWGGNSIVMVLPQASIGW
jgi:hypothetical protein